VSPHVVLRSLFEAVLEWLLLSLSAVIEHTVHIIKR
jgi:hypothetical protein